MPSVHFNPVKDIPDQSGRVFLVTGGNVGLGQETCLQIAKHNPKQIYLAARSEKKANESIASIKSIVPNANITFLELDLGDFDSIKRASDEFQSKENRLDVLYNNAGVMALPSGKTKSGYEIQFGTNHMGHALLTKLLMPILQRTAQIPDSDVRIICLSSDAHSGAPKGGILFQFLTTPMEEISTFARYGQSKTANILFMRELDKRYPNITTVAIHPGIVQTNLLSTFQKEHPIIGPPIGVLKSIFMKTVPQGTLNQLWAGTAPKVDSHGGRGKKGVKSGSYYSPIGIESQGSAVSQDMKLARKLWDWTDEELSQKGFKDGW